MTTTVHAGAARQAVASPRIAPLLQAFDLDRSFAMRRSLVGLLRGETAASVRALNGVSLSIARGETLAVVGESGCGKSTLARALVRLIELDAGQIDFAGTNVRALRGAALRHYNRHVQLVFQDPYGSLNPRMRVREILSEVLAVHRIVPRATRPARIAELLSLVRLPSDIGERLPHQLSGGQRQRVAIARALAVEPDLLIADEVVSALDVSVQAQILNLLLELQQRLGLAMLFVSHDLRVVRHLAHRVAVMYLGKIVETGPADRVFDKPAHPYTQALLRAAPKLVPGGRSREAALSGELPSPLAIPSGCPFHPRCPRAMEQCRATPPASVLLAPGHYASCHLWSSQVEG
jgi:oligopeptide/dipeptide ABC transporter ATP-binding protein